MNAATELMKIFKHGTRYEVSTLPLGSHFIHPDPSRNSLCVIKHIGDPRVPEEAIVYREIATGRVEGIHKRNFVKFQEVDLSCNENNVVIKQEIIENG